MNKPITVTILNRAYQMSRKQAKGLLDIASEQVPFGIYAVEKGGKISMEHMRCSSITQLKSKVREFRSAGFKVYYNGL